jgi:isopropylmalate/homocitrate/citramalate synthase
MTQTIDSEKSAPNLFASLPRKVRIVEVGPRDGLQNEPSVLSTDDKARYIALLAEAGLRDIEVTSFVNPKRVPQLADAESLFEQLPSSPGARYWALVPNRRGLDRALASGVRNIALFTAASETFTRRNIGMSIAESLDEFRAIMPIARENGMTVRAYVSTAFVCPFEGPIEPSEAARVVRALTEMGVDEISVGDTVGHATPLQVAALTEALAPLLPLEMLAYHFHDTRGTALANVLAALQLGVTSFDSASGGVGGCPFAPGAAGNLATEDLLYMLDGMGIETGVRLGGVVEASRFLASRLGRALPGKYLQSAASQ